MPTVQIDFGAEACALPPPLFPQGATLLAALKCRRSTRAFHADPIPVETLSALLWAAAGINRPESGGRTAPSAHDWQEIDVYVVLPEGSFRYDAAAHRLTLVNTEDLRARTGLQDFVGQAPLDLVYVADFARMDGARPEEREFFAGADSGFIAQSAYLACAALGLGSVVRALIDRRTLAPALGLRTSQRIVLAQTIGLPLAPSALP